MSRKIVVSRIKLRHGIAQLAVIAISLTCLSDVAAEPLSFNRDIRPILSGRCFECHGPDANRREADLRLDVRDSAIADLGGYAAIVPGKPGESSLIDRITTTDEDLRMPPADKHPPLSSDEAQRLRTWVEEGANYELHWSFEPTSRPRTPLVDTAFNARNNIDHFVLAKLDKRSLEPSREAERLTLLRRVTLDLTGLPPSPDEIDRFMADSRPDAYERVVERLLASPDYGEHMALPWLEAARYADTSGYQADWERFMWPWRNWLIDAYNAGMTFDQFTVEQLAGDLLPNATTEQILATGFNRNHRINDEGGIIPEEYAVEYVVDRVDTTSTVWLGLTMGCVRCHDHKYDPFSQEDFYSLFAFFNNVPEKGKDGRVGYSLPAIDYENEEVSLQIKHLNQQISSASGKAKAELEKQVKQLEAKRTVKVMVMSEMEKPRETFVLTRGEYDHADKQRPVSPRIPSIFGELPAETPSNRLGFARWLVSRDNPLTARVAVNRYWQMYFGRGLVETIEDFGSQGSRPSHPQLLDWLAFEFMDSGWDVKQMQRTIVTSATYRQSSRSTKELTKQDPNNALLARGPRLRLSGQAIRDQALAASGLLMKRIGGPSVKPYQPPGLWSEVSFQSKKRSTDFFVQDHGEKLYRRSLYTFWKRSVAPPQMLTFDAAAREACVVRMTRTSTPLQSLTLMNDVTFVEAARGMATRMMTEASSGLRDRIAYGMKLLAIQPNDYIMQVLMRGYRDYRLHFKQAPEKAVGLLTVGESSADASLDQVELAALTSVASVLLSLDQTITKE